MASEGRFRGRESWPRNSLRAAIPRERASGGASSQSWRTFGACDAPVIRVRIPVGAKRRVLALGARLILCAHSLSPRVRRESAVQTGGTAGPATAAKAPPRAPRVAAWMYAQGRAILWPMRRSVAAAILCIGLQACGPASAADTVELNRLAARCAVCHSAATQPTSPLLEGQPPAYFIAQMRAFRERRRSNPPMVAFANELSDQDLSALAGYYAAREPAQLEPVADPAQIDAGRSKAAELRCAQCHGPALEGSKSGAARLAGQKPRYTAWSLHMMRSGSRTHGPGRDPLLSGLTNNDIDALAAWFASVPPR